MILFKPNLDFEIESVIADKNGRYLLLKTSMFESSFLLSNIYAPNDITAQIAFFRNLDNILLPYADSQIILRDELVDGLSGEFYLQFWHLLGEEMVESFNYAHKLGKLNITQRQGIIKITPKKRKNRLCLENWRPLTLLNVDYKIATKSIAHRIAKVLPKLINEDQTGYFKGRYIGQNIRLINDIMKITELENIPGMAIFIDFKKAFDIVDWNFFFKTLEALNFGP